MAKREDLAAPKITSLKARSRIPCLLLLELAIGLAVSMGLFMLARGLERAHARQDFETTADNYREALQRNMDGALDALYSVKAMVESRASVERGEFRSFANVMLARHPEILSVEWLPRVAGGERSNFVSWVRESGFPDFDIKEAVKPGEFVSASEKGEYYPVLYLEPLTENRDALGFDPSTEPSRNAAMRRAAETGQASATEAVVLLRPRQDGQHPRAVQLVAPVYLSQAAGGDSAGDKKAPAGYARTILLVERMVGAAWQGLSRDELGAVVRDAEDPSRRILSYPINSSLDGFQKGPRWEGVVKLADRSWKLEFRPAAASMNQAWGWWTRSVLIGGLALTLLGAAYMRAVLRRQKDQRLANEQLSKLASTAPGAIFAFRLRPDGTSCFPYASPRLTELFGIKPAEVIADSAPAWARVHPDDVNQLQATIAGAAKNLSPWKCIFRACHPLKGWIWVEGSSMPMQEASGDILWHGFLIDITERQRLESALQNAGETAQGRIARDLHDGLGQQLGGALYLGQLLQRDLRARGAPEADRAGELNRLIRDGLDLTRNVARGLHPVPEQPDGLMFALQTMIEQFAIGSEAEFAFECQEPVLIQDVRVASQLYRIAQEAANNAVKHSRATRIEISLRQESNAISLTVRDNGIGFAHGSVGSGLGRHSMEYRARLIGALIRIENAPERGVLVTCRVPLSPVGPLPLMNPAGSRRPVRGFVSTKTSKKDPVEAKPIP